MALKRKGKYYYGESVDDVWTFFVWWTDGRVKHGRQAICKCGCVVFQVSSDEEEHFYERFCTACDIDVVMFADEFADLPPDPDQREPDSCPYECICGRDAFEVVGVTEPFGCGDRPNSARTFYLGMRCVHCGCLGGYAEWNPRYNDADAFLDML